MGLGRPTVVGQRSEHGINNARGRRITNQVSMGVRCADRGRGQTGSRIVAHEAVGNVDSGTANVRRIPRFVSVLAIIVL